MSKLACLLAAGLVVPAGACSPQGGDGGSPGGGGGKADDLGSCSAADQMIEARPAFGGLTFDTPIALLPAPAGAADAASRWYVAEKRGVLLTFTVGEDGAASEPAVVLDLRALVNAEPGEAGLLGVAFSPDFAGTGEIYLSYTAPSATSPVNLRSRLSRAISTDGGLTIDPATVRPLLGADQPFENHNGGHIAFGPDGLLYMGLGDGGSAGDPGDRAQDTASGLGKLLRIDVRGGAGYTIPADNPFASGGGLGEIYALGLRNPWRFSFDEETGRLWLADVGQDSFEEVNLIERGGNYGWRVREAAHCFDPATGCATDGLIDPVAEYGRDEGISITGGFVYRGAAIPALAGQYVFGDFGSGRIWSLLQVTEDGFERRLLADTALNIASFGRGPDGELYALDFATGGIFQLAGLPCGSGAAGGDAGPDPGMSPMPQGEVSFRDVYDQVIAPRCAPCHTQRSFGNLGMPTAETAFERLVGVPAATSPCSGRVRVVAGAPSDSVLWQKLSGEDLCGSSMPPDGPLTPDQLATVKAWIDQGAPF